MVGVKRRFLSFLNSSANAKMAFFIVFQANFLIGKIRIQNAIFKVRSAVGKTQKRRFTTTITHHVPLSTPIGICRQLRLYLTSCSIRMGDITGLFVKR